MKFTPLLVVLMVASAAWCQTTQPAKPAAAANPDEMLKQLMLVPPRNTPIQPEPDDPRIDQTTKTAVAPKAPTQNLIREGTYLLDKVGRLTRTADGQPEFTFEIDGQAMKDPPMIILPNLQLMIMEDALKRPVANPKFRVTAMVTEYGSRNYILIEKARVLSDGSIPPQPSKNEKNR